MISYRVALSILLLQQSTAFQAVSTSFIYQHRCTSSTQIYTASIESSSTTLESILIDDTNGHINSELASAIYEWEVAHNDRQHSDKESFSTRDGLRLGEYLFYPYDVVDIDCSIHVLCYCVLVLTNFF